MYYESLHRQISLGSPRVAELGMWPDWVDPMAIIERLPDPQGGQTASGFDAGMACALDLIPRERQRLSAVLHAAYTPEAVRQVREETSGDLDPDSESAWWLAACSICEEGKLTFNDLVEQLEAFDVLRLDAGSRVSAAANALHAMKHDFELRDGIAFALRDGGMQGAYIAGHELAGAYNDQLDLHFLGTFHQSLGLEDFGWSSDTDEQGLARSGPVHGSRQFVKCSSQDEYQRASKLAREYLLA